MSVNTNEVNELAAKILPGMRERAQIHFSEALQNCRSERGLPMTTLVEVLLKTMSEELACIVIGLRK